MNEWDKQNVAYPLNGILFTLTKEGYTAACCNTDEPGDIMLTKEASHRATNGIQFPLHKVPRLVKLLTTVVWRS